MENARRAAHLSKADLTTRMVTEFTELEGTMGRIYAEASGENPIVAKSIEQQYYPRRAGGKLPTMTCGKILSVADKLDSIAGMTAIGLKTTGSQDPFGLRRNAIGILRILKEEKSEIFCLFKEKENVAWIITFALLGLLLCQYSSKIGRASCRERV